MQPTLRRLSLAPSLSPLCDSKSFLCPPRRGLEYQRFSQTKRWVFFCSLCAEQIASSPFPETL